MYQFQWDLLRQDPPPASHPCFHTYENAISEAKFWGCAQRDIDRDYLKGIADVQQLKLEARIADLDEIFDWVGMGCEEPLDRFGGIVENPRFQKPGMP